MEVTMAVTRTLVDIDDSLLARAAAKLGTVTKKDTVNRALELAATKDDADHQAEQRFRDFASRTASRMAEIDWDQAWR
jgi:Arc/MetJ family transcription regulator